MSLARQQFIDKLKLKGLSDVTIKDYVLNVSLCARHFNRSPLELTHEDIGRYFLHLKEVKHNTPKTINQVFYSLRSFYRHLMQDSAIMEGYGRMKEPVKIPKVLSKEEVETLVDSCADLKTKAVIAVLYSSGIRLAECAALKVTDVDKHRMVLRIVHGKGGKDRFAVLSERTRLLLREYYRRFRPKYWLFENRRHTRPLDRRQIQRIVQVAGLVAGIKKNVTPHILRHSFATHMLESGKPLQGIQVFMGHTTIRSTVRYTHVSSKLLNSMGSPFDEKKPKNGGLS